VNDRKDIDIFDKQLTYAVIKKCWSLITLLKQPSILSSLLDQLPSQMEIKRGLPTDCETRWNSTFYLINSFIFCKKLLIKFFGDKMILDIRFSLVEWLISIELQGVDWDLLVSLHTVLKLFDLAKKRMSDTSHPIAGLC
jgi:hypothetical protein